MTVVLRSCPEAENGSPVWWNAGSGLGYGGNDPFGLVDPCGPNGITRLADCQTASAALGYRFSQAISVDNEPYGCIYRVSLNDVVFNGRDTGIVFHGWIRPYHWRREALCKGESPAVAKGYECERDGSNFSVDFGCGCGNYSTCDCQCSASFNDRSNESFCRGLVTDKVVQVCPRLGEVTFNGRSDDCIMHVMTEGKTCDTFCRRQGSTCVTAMDTTNGLGCSGYMMTENRRDDTTSLNSCFQESDDQICVCNPLPTPRPTTRPPRPTPYPTWPAPGPCQYWDTACINWGSRNPRLGEDSGHPRRGRRTELRDADETSESGIEEHLQAPDRHL